MTCHIEAIAWHYRSVATVFLQKLTSKNDVSCESFKRHLYLQTSFIFIVFHISHEWHMTSNKIIEWQVQKSAKNKEKLCIDTKYFVKFMIKEENVVNVFTQKSDLKLKINSSIQNYTDLKRLHTIQTRKLSWVSLILLKLCQGQDS